MKKLFAMLLLVAMLTASLCSLAESEWAEADLYAGIDFSEPMTISIYYTGNECPDWKMVNDLINAELKAKINTTIEFVHVSFADFITSYSLFLAGGEDIDLIYNQPVNNLPDNAKAGAFAPLSEEFIKTYMPQTWAKQDKASWPSVTVNGVIYGVPSNRNRTTGSVVYTCRSLMDKYGYTEADITTPEQLDEYLYKVAEGEKGTGIYPINCHKDYPSDWVYLPLDSHCFDVNSGTGIWAMWDYSTGKAFHPDDLQWYADTDAFMEWALKMADYYADGIFPSGVMSNDTTYGLAFRTGMSAIYVGNTSEVDTHNAYISQLGDELVILNCLYDEGSQILRSGYGHKLCITASSTKKERAAVVMDLLKFDPVIHKLIIGGVEGVHYNVTQDGKYRIDTEKTQDYWWDNRMFFLQDNTDLQLEPNGIIKPFIEQLETRMLARDTFPAADFLYDNSKYENEIAVLNSIFNEFRFAFCFGLYGDDTEAQVKEYRETMHALGVDDVLEDYKTQLKNYMGL